MMSKHVREMHCCMVVAHHLISQSGFFIMFITQICNSQWFVTLMHLSLASCTPPVCWSSCGTSYEDRKRKTRGNRKWDITKQGREGSTQALWVKSESEHPTTVTPQGINPPPSKLLSDQINSLRLKLIFIHISAAFLPDSDRCFFCYGTMN